MKKLIIKLRKKYSFIDTIIILSTIFITLGLLFYFMSFYTLVTVKVLGHLLAIVYILFIISHLFIMMPLFIIIMIIHDWVEENIILPDSIIILRFVQFIFITITCFIIYVCIPFLAAMMINGNFDLLQAFELIKKTNNS